MARCIIIMGILIIGLADDDVWAQESLPARTVAAVKDATVMIAISDPADTAVSASGSGFSSAWSAGPS